jgi:hypothetical protein
VADFFNNVTSISWWIGVVIVGILVNLAAIYLKSPLDRLLSSISTKYRIKSKPQKAELDAKIRNLIGNKQEQILYASKINFTLGVSIFRLVNGASLIIASGLLNIAKYQSPTIKNIWGFKQIIFAATLTGGFMIFWGLFSYAHAFFDQQILKEAKDRESKC